MKALQHTDGINWSIASLESGDTLWPSGLNGPVEKVIWLLVADRDLKALTLKSAGMKGVCCAGTFCSNEIYNGIKRKTMIYLKGEDATEGLKLVRFLAVKGDHVIVTVASGDVKIENELIRLISEL